MAKRIKIEVDQSGKIEQTNINTVIALTNNKNFSIIFKKGDKRILEKAFKKMGKGKGYPYIVFAALLAILLKLSGITNKATVDREYMGHENTIRERTLHFLRSLGVKNDIVIEFGHVGKLSKAHNLAAKVGSKKLKPNKIVSLKEVLELIFEVTPIKKTEVGKRLKNA